MITNRGTTAEDLTLIDVSKSHGASPDITLPLTKTTNDSADVFSDCSPIMLHREDSFESVVSSLSGGISNFDDLDDGKQYDETIAKDDVIKLSRSVPLTGYGSFHALSNSQSSLDKEIKEPPLAACCVVS